MNNQFKKGILVQLIDWARAHPDIPELWQPVMLSLTEQQQQIIHIISDREVPFAEIKEKLGTKTKESSFLKVVLRLKDYGLVEVVGGEVYAYRKGKTYRYKLADESLINWIKSDR